MAVLVMVSGGIQDLSGDIRTQLDDGSIISSSFGAGGPGGFSGLNGCSGGTGAITSFAAAQAAAGNWDVAGEGPNYGAFDPADVPGEIASYYRSVSAEEAQEHIGWWEADFASRGDSMHPSDFVEWATVECIAAGAPLS